MTAGAWLLHFTFPLLRLQGTPWLPLWRERDRRNLRVATRVTFALGALGMIGHYFLVDRPLGLAPASLWATYRFGVAAALLFLGAMTFSPRFPPRLLLAAGILLICYLQARSMTWFQGVPYAYAIVFACIGAALLQMSMVQSILFLILVFGLEWPSLVAAGAPLTYVLSAAAVGTILVAVFRARMGSEVAWFLAEQEKMEAQKRAIESEMELNEEIRSFLPREIYVRVLHSRQNHRATVLQAMDDALRPKLRTVACIFTDVRGFTQQSKDLSGFLVHRALPNIRICTDLVESFRGIPRLIGDLVLAYFDGRAPIENLSDALACAVALVDRNEEWNDEVPVDQKVRRFVLVSFGEAVVGNIGGTGGSREITALGSCVNILSRIDPLTKSPSLAGQLSAKTLILTRQAAEAARFGLPDLELVRVDLAALSLTIRDFPEETAIWLMPVNDRNRSALAAAATASIGAESPPPHGRVAG